MKIGVFDSGLGGLTIIKDMLKNVHGADFVYIADTKNAPYGEKSSDEIINFSKKITSYLLEHHHIEALVVACNTATSAAIATLREEYRNLIIIGTEPGLKPAIIESKTKRVGILATPATLNGQKYRDLAQKLSSEYHVKLYENACAGLVEQIEKGETKSEKTVVMIGGWLKEMREDEVDAIVLGCTHYPLVADAIRDVMGRDVMLIETAGAISKRVNELCNLEHNHKENTLHIYATGEIRDEMVTRILNKEYQVKKIAVG